MSTQDILNLGNDQLSSQFDLYFIGGIPTGGGSDNVTLRCSLEFSNPAETVNKYALYKKGVKVEKTGTLTETDKVIIVKWRVDQDWVTFDDMIAWKNAVYDPITGTGMPDNMVRGTLEFQAVDTQNTVKKKIRYTNCKPFQYELDPFNSTTSEPIYCTMQFIYVDRKIESA
jgi:hypothetical protein